MSSTSGMMELFQNGWLSDVLLYSALTILLAFLFMKFTKSRHMVNEINKIPGHKGNFIFGNALQLIASPKELFNLFTGTFSNYGKSVSKIWLFNIPFVILHKASSAEVILNNKKNITKDIGYNTLVPWLGTGLLIATGKKWHTRRKMLTPTFHFKILGDFVDVFNNQSAKFVSKLAENGTNKFFDVFGYVTKCTLDIILETAVGVSIDAQDNPDSEYVKAVYTMSTLAQVVFARLWLRWPFIFWLLGYKKMQDDAVRVLHKFSNGIIAKKRRDYKKPSNTNNISDDAAVGAKKKLAFMDLLIEKAEEDQSLTNEDIREEVDTFVFEGHDTTAAGVSFAIFLLACHPEIQAKVHKELDSIFQGSNRPATVDDIRQMKYLECCIKEAQRIYPSVPFIGRYLTEPIEIDGCTIPADTSVFVIIHRIHRDPEQFPDPEKFDPERFYPENAAKRHPFAYVPFSAGPRNCIGQKFALMEEKVVVSSLFRQYRVESAVQQKDLQILGELISRPESGIDIKLHPRN